jgi:hypothetical protein
MDCEKVAVFILMLVVLVLSGCGQGFRNGVTQKAQDDTVCLKRVDLKLIMIAKAKGRQEIVKLLTEAGAKE